MSDLADFIARMAGALDAAGLPYMFVGSMAREQWLSLTAER